MRGISGWLRRLVGEEVRDQEFVDEVEEHVKLLAERFRRQGMTAGEAERAARRQFGNAALVEEDRRSLRTLSLEPGSSSRTAIWGRSSAISVRLCRRSN